MKGVCIINCPPQGFRPDGEIPRYSSNSRVYYGKYLELKCTVSMPQKNLDLLEQGREESVGNDDVSVIRARKYEMVRMT